MNARGGEENHLFWQDAAHDVVVAHAVNPAELFGPVRDAVAVAEDREGPDVRRGVVHQRSVHVEQCCFLHRRFVFPGPARGGVCPGVFVRQR